MATPEEERNARMASVVAYMMQSPQGVDLLKSALSRGGYSLLRQVSREAFPTDPDPTRLALAGCGVLLDVETTGFVPGEDKVIQLAMLKFYFDEKGIFALGEGFDRLRDPGTEISAEITSLTGITSEMVKGQQIDDVEVAEFLSDASICVAHNAAFDRKFCEGDFPRAGFDRMAWHCSLEQVDWVAREAKGKKLELLALGAGYVYDAHNAFSDVLATAFVLAEHPGGEVSPFSEMILNGETPAIQIIAENAPFDRKEDLKANGYRWSPDGLETGGIKSWHKFIPGGTVSMAAEADFLRDIYRRDVSLPAYRFLPTERYSARRSERVHFATAEIRDLAQGVNMAAAPDRDALPAQPGFGF